MCVFVSIYMYACMYMYILQNIYSICMYVCIFVFGILES